MEKITDEQDLADRAVAVYNEPDAQKRNKDIAALWTPTGEHFGGFHAKGYPGLEEGIQGAHDNHMGKNNMAFRAYNARRREDVVFFMFDGVSTKTGEVLAFGSGVLILAEDGRIQKDYTFALQDRYAPGGNSRQ